MLVGGGTGGHIFPGLAVAHELRALVSSVDCRFAVGRKPIELSWLAAGGVTSAVRLFSAPVPFGFRPIGLGRAAAAVVLGTAQALAWWLRWRPAAMLTFGGYVSVPGAAAARLLDVPYVYHSADALPDRSARLLARRARLVTVNYPQAAEHFHSVRVVVTGQPVRPWLLGADRAEAAGHLGLSADRPTLLVMGGSQGARSINRAAAAAAAELTRSTDLQALHLTGHRDYETVRETLAASGVPPERWKAVPFLAEMQYALAIADLAVTRAGANGLAELAAAGVPMLMVPYPYAGGHQLYNAQPIADAGAGIIIEDAQLSAERLVGEVRALLADQAALKEMSAAARRWAKPDAARRVAELVAQVAGCSDGA